MVMALLLLLLLLRLLEVTSMMMVLESGGGGGSVLKRIPVPEDVQNLRPLTLGLLAALVFGGLVANQTTDLTSRHSDVRDFLVLLVLLLVVAVGDVDGLLLDDIPV